MILSLAVTCSFCSKPDLKTSESESTKETVNTGSQPDADQNEYNNKPTDINGETDTGTPPKIITVFYMDDDITEFLKREALTVQYVSGEHDFIIIAEDADGDELIFNIAPEHGEVVNIERVDNESVSFVWICPDNVDSSIEPLSTRINVTVRDAAGNEDLFNINIAMLPVLDMEPVESEGEDAERREIVSIAADSSLSGYITKDTEIRTGVVMVGDWTNNKQIKGYLTFYLSDFGAIFRDVVINEVSFRFDNINKSGSPELLSDLIDFKAFNYGNSLDAGDFAVGGTSFISVSTGVFTAGRAGFGSYMLDSLLQDAVSSGQEKFQIKIGLKTATDNDGVSDIFQCHPETVFMDINYSY